MICHLGLFFVGLGFLDQSDSFVRYRSDQGNNIPGLNLCTTLVGMGVSLSTTARVICSLVLSISYTHYPTLLLIRLLLIVSSNYLNRKPSSSERIYLDRLHLLHCVRHRATALMFLAPFMLVLLGLVFF